MALSTEPQPQPQSQWPPQPRFDCWGEDLRRARGQTRRRRPRRAQLSWRGLALLALICAGGAALAVHLAAGPASGSSATTTVLPSTATPQAVAHAVNLRLSDLPGFRLGSGGGVSATGESAGQLKQCLGSGAGIVGGAAGSSSPDFMSGAGLQAVSLGSTVSVVSASQLARDDALAGNPRLPQCLANAIASMKLGAHGTTITGSDPIGATLPPPVLPGGAVRSMVATRASLTWTANGLPIPVYLDLYVVAVGHDEVSLYAFSTQQPYPMADAQRLIALLVGRALAQPH